MKGMRTRPGRSALVVVVLTCAIVFLVFGLLGSVGFLMSNGVGWFRDVDWTQFGVHFGVGQEFTVDDAQSYSLDGIDRIIVSSISTNPVFETGGTELSSTLKGTCRSFTDPVKLEVRKTGNMLRVSVKYPTTGVTSTQLDFRIAIPASYAGSLEIDAVSADVFIMDPGFRLGTFKAVTVSGDLKVYGLAADSYDVATTSGGIIIHGVTGEVKAYTVSGDVEVIAEKGHAFDASTVSGTVELSLPSDTAFTWAFRTVSGEYFIDFESVFNGNLKEPGGTVGSGGPVVHVNTVSGDFRIHELS